MAVAPTGNIFKALSFDNVSSRTYGVYITGEAVYNAPEREVEMISIPGRNGAFALDKGRFENIEVTYPAGIFADNEANFAEAISDFRNFLCSRNGYVRLSDEYNPNEYRMAVYKSGLEVSPALLKAGEFDITFDCKPQRFLTSGETEVTVASGGTLTNPTLFDSSPLLAIEGYGDIVINGHTAVELNDATVGTIELVKAGTAGSVYRGIYRTQYSLVDDGDTMTLNDFSVRIRLGFKQYGSSITNAEFTRTTASIPNYIGVDTVYESAGSAIVTLNFGEQSFTKQSADTEYIDECRIRCTVQRPNYSPTNFNYTFKLRVLNYGTASESAGELRIEVFDNTSTNFQNSIAITASSFIANSTQSVLGHPTYIDCDTGMAYKRSNGKIVSLNRYVDLGTDLPTLKAGSNSFFLQNTITSLKVAPRWWKV